MAKYIPIVLDAMNTLEYGTFSSAYEALNVRYSNTALEFPFRMKQLVSVYRGSNRVLFMGARAHVRPCAKSPPEKG